MFGRISREMGRNCNDPEGLTFAVQFQSSREKMYHILSMISTGVLDRDGLSASEHVSDPKVDRHLPREMRHKIRRSAFYPSPRSDATSRAALLALPSLGTFLALLRE